MKKEESLDEAGSEEFSLERSTCTLLRSCTATGTFTPIALSLKTQWKYLAADRDVEWECEGHSMECSKISCMQVTIEQNWPEHLHINTGCSTNPSSHSRLVNLVSHSLTACSATAQKREDLSVYKVKRGNRSVYYTGIHFFQCVVYRCHSACCFLLPCLESEGCHLIPL